jgi:hypothetical protein
MAQQHHADQRSGAKIERRARLDEADAVALGGARLGGEGLKIDLGDLQLCLGGDPLHRLALDLEEAGAQDFVARQDLVPSLLQERGVERALELPAHRDVVGGVAGLQAIEQPEALLRDRAREVAVLGGVRERAARGRCGGRGVPRVGLSVPGAGSGQNLFAHRRHQRLRVAGRRSRWNCPSVGSAAFASPPSTGVAAASARAAMALSVRSCRSCLAVKRKPSRVERAII